VLLRSGFSKKIQTRRNDKFNSMIKEERAVERLRFDDERMIWEDDKEYPIVETLTISGIKVQQSDLKLLKDPAGFKGPRDKKHLKMVERLQRKERLHRLKDMKPKEESVRQIQIGENIQEKLNDILEDIDKVPDPDGSSSLVSPILHDAAVRFIQVKMTRDLTTARCLWECRPTYETQVRNQLSIFKPQIRRLLTSKVAMRYSPRLVFEYNVRKIITDQIETAKVQIQDENLKAGEEESGDDEPIPVMTREQKIANFQQIAREFIENEMPTADWQYQFRKITANQLPDKIRQSVNPPKKSKTYSAEDAIKDNFMDRSYQTTQSPKTRTDQE